MHKVVFVCLGNICRSPMAEAVFRQKVKDRGLADRFQIESRATSAWEKGKGPHEGTQRKLQSIGISVKGMSSEQMEKADFMHFDLILGMDHQNVHELERFSPKEMAGKIHLLLEVLPGNSYQEVPDPYYTGDFDLTFELIDEATSKWLELILEK